MIGTPSVPRADLRRFLLAEMAVGAVVNGAIAGLIAWAVLSGSQSVPVWGGGGLVFDLLPSTVLPVLAMGVIVPTVLRKRYRKGEALPTCDWDDLGRWGRLMCRGTAARAVLLSIVWAAFFVPAGAVMLWIGGWSDVPLLVALSGKALFGALVGASAAPFVALPALAQLENRRSIPERETYAR